MRYGGVCEAKWDGVGLWTPTALPEGRREALCRLLTSAREAFPAVPEDFDGWYYRK